MQYLGTDTDFRDISTIAPYLLERRDIQQEILAHPNVSILDTVETGWTQEVATFAYDTTDFLLGTQSGRLTTTSGSFNAIVGKTVAYNLSDRTISIWLKKTSTITGITLFLLAPNWSNYGVFGIGVANYPNDTWFNCTFPVSAMTTFGSPNFGNVTLLRIEAIGSNNSATLRFDGIRMASSSLSNGAIIITFDDVNSSDYLMAKPKMDEYGYRGVSFVVGNQIGQSGKLTLAQMKLMQDVGWDISSHSWSHPYYTAISADEIRQETVRTKHYLTTNGFASGARFFAYPYGATNTTASDIVMRYHLIARGAGSFGVNLGMSNVPLFSPTYMECASVLNTTSTADLNTWINNVKNRKALGCILFHRLVASAPTEYEYLQANFNTFIDNIAAAGVPVITLSDLVDRYLPAPVSTFEPTAWLNLA